jgi:phosphate starvation-inducible PhoH-like protein
MFVTRMGRSSKFVITGDITQIDLPRNQNSGLVQAMKILHNIKGIDFITLDIRDVVRHKLVTRIINAYEKKA